MRGEALGRISSLMVTYDMPEPSSLARLGTGLIVVAVAVRRRRKRKA